MAKDLVFVDQELFYRMKRVGRQLLRWRKPLGRHRSTIDREWQRNAGQRRYRPQQAQRQAGE